MREHKPVVVDQFNGLWARGGRDPASWADTCPPDHFWKSNNVQFSEGMVRTRDGLDTLVAKNNVVRMYNYVMQTGDSLLVLDTNGDFWHSLLDGSGTTYGPILSIPDAEDFAMTTVAGRAYISPFKTVINAESINQSIGLENEFLYVYKGDGTNARKAAGFPPSNPVDTPFIGWNSTIDGNVTQGIHVLAVTFGDGTPGDDSTGLGTTVKPVVYAPGGKQINVDNLPIGGVGITQRFIWMTLAIDPKDWNPDTTTYTYYLAATVNDNTSKNAIISIADEELTTPFAAGTLPNPTSGGLTAENSATEGFCDLGLHVIGVVYETDTGFLTAPGPEKLAVQSFVNGLRAITVKNIPVSPDSFVIGRRLVASKMISLYNGDDRGFQLFFIPDGVINDNTTTELTVSFFDADLLEDASHLIDNFSEIPAFAFLNKYHARLVGGAEFANISVARLSAPGEPEAINQVDGLIIDELDGNSLTAAQEFRDVMYLTKQTKTTAYNDNGDTPDTWAPGTVIDNGIGASIHGIGAVLDTKGVNIEFLLIIDFSGLMLFNGLYTRPELSWKIEDLWLGLDRTKFDKMQIMNDSINKFIYIVMPDGTMLRADYKNGLNFKNIKWTPWSFDISVSTIALINKDVLAVGSFELRS